MPVFRRAVLAGLAALLLGIAARPDGALAHASLVRSVPAAGAVLREAPGRVELGFSEPPELKFSEARVLRSDGTVVVEKASLTALDPLTIQFPLPALTDATYTVAWRNVSAVDGHPNSGVFSFTIGDAPVYPDPPTAASQQPAGGPSKAWLLLGKLLSYAGFAMLLALGLVLPVVVLPAIGAAADDDLWLTASRAVRLTAFPAIGLTLSSLVFALFLQAWANGNDALSMFSGTTTTILESTRFGTTWIVRAALSIVASGCLLVLATDTEARLRAARRGTTGLLGLLAVAAAVLPFTLGWNTHLAAEAARLSGGALAGGAHVLAATVWFGGLASLALLTWRIRQILPATGGEAAVRTAVARFSPLAAVAALFLIATGVVAWWQLVGSIHDTVTTSYGRLILVKLTLLMGMLALAARNLAYGRRGRPAKWPGISGSRSFGRSVIAEACLGIAALAFAGVLSATPPPRDVVVTATQAPAGIVYTSTEDGAEVRLAVFPGVAGSNSLTFEVSGLPQSVRFAQFIVRMTYLEQEIGTVEVEAAPVNGRGFSVNGSHMSLPGRWMVDVIGLTDGKGVRASFEVAIQAP